MTLLFWKRVLLSWYLGVRTESFWVEVDENVVIAIQPPFVSAVAPSNFKNPAWIIGSFLPARKVPRMRNHLVPGCRKDHSITQKRSCDEASFRCLDDELTLRR